MKKIIGSFTLFTLLLITLIACNNSPAYDEHLIGTWRFTEYENWTYLFNADGTGVRDGEDFTWHTEEDRLYIICSVQMFGVTNERWTFVITDDVLRLTSLQDETHEGWEYIRN